MLVGLEDENVSVCDKDQLLGSLLQYKNVLMAWASEAPPFASRSGMASKLPSRRLSVGNLKANIFL